GRYRMHPEADISLARSERGFLARQRVQWGAFLRLLPETDIFHFYFGLTLEQLEYANRADAQIVGSYDASRWVPSAYVVPPGIDLSAIEPVPPSDRRR